MSGQGIGYIRVSTLDQHTERQLDGIAVDKTFTDKASGKDTKRPQLELMMSFVRSGDTVIVHSMTGSPATWMTCATSCKRSPAKASGSNSSKNTSPSRAKTHPWPN